MPTLELASLFINSFKKSIMKTKILTIAILCVVLLSATISQIAFAGYTSKSLSSYNRYDRLQDNNLTYVEPVNGYISYSATVSCSSTASDYSSAEVILWGDFSGYQATLYVPDNGSYYKTFSDTIYPYSTTQGGWLEASLYANGYGSTASMQANW
jgi:hypothetical protein